ncbi:MAG: hypothetical protein ACSLFM_02660 [Tepidiformaceae bacterium]
MDEQVFRYCAHCGRRFPPELDACPGCRRRWAPTTFPDTRFTAKAMLEVLQGWRAEGLLSAESFEELRLRTEASFRIVGAPAGEAVAPASAAAPSRVPVPREPGPGLGALVAERQADLLLYLGAFLLGVAALIFVSVQEGELSAAVRVPVLAAYTLAGIVGGMLVRRWERVREAGHVFLALGALLVPLNVVLIYTDVLEDRDVPGDVVWLLGSVFCAVFYGALAARGLGWLYRIPASIALFSGWSSIIALSGMPIEWGGAWYMLLASIIAGVSAPRWKGVAVSAAVLGGFALTWSYAAVAGDHPWQLATTHLVATAGLGFAAYRARFGAAVFGVLPLAAGAVSAALWASGAPSPTFAYPLLATGGLALAMRATLSKLPATPGAGPWWYAAIVAVSPLLVMVPTEYAGWSGLGMLGSAALFAVLAWKNTGHGLTAAATTPQKPATRTQWGERAAYAWIAAAFALAGATLLQDGLGVTDPDTGWLFAALAIVPPLAVAFFPPFRATPALTAGIPMSVTASILALPQDGHLLHATAYLALPGIAWLAASALSRRWTAAVVGVGFLTVAAFPLRAEVDWPTWALALGFAIAGLGIFASLTRQRAYPASTERPVSIIVLSWGLHAVALAVAAGAILAFQSDRDETGRALLELTVERGDYRAMIGLVAVLALLVAFEGSRLARRMVYLPASAIGMIAVLLAVGLPVPTNVQAYTAPLGAYLIGIGLVIRRSPPLIPPHLQWHELALVAGVGCVVLPQAEQSFDPGGDIWGLVLIAEGLAFLALGLVLRARWLVPAGTLVLSGVAIRWLLETSETIPYWVTLGAVGTILLAVGLFVMVKAEWWQSTRARASRWWQDPGDPPGRPAPTPDL